MLQRKMVVLIGIMVLFSMILSACTTVAPAAQPAAPAAEGGEASWWRTAAESANCVGVTINGVTESTEPGKYAKATLIPAFEAESGIKV